MTLGQKESFAPSTHTTASFTSWQVYLFLNIHKWLYLNNGDSHLKCLERHVRYSVQPDGHATPHQMPHMFFQKLCKEPALINLSLRLYQPPVNLWAETQHEGLERLVKEMAERLSTLGPCDSVSSSSAKPFCLLASGMWWVCRLLSASCPSQRCSFPTTQSPGREDAGQEEEVAR